MDLDEKLLDAVREAAREGRITCAKARKLALELGLTPRKVGEACNILGIKIKACELGCF